MTFCKSPMLLTSTNYEGRCAMNIFVTSWTSRSRISRQDERNFTRLWGISRLKKYCPSGGMDLWWRWMRGKQKTKKMGIWSRWERGSVAEHEGSLTAFEIGLFGWMAIYQIAIFNWKLGTVTTVYWWMMQVGMILGFATAFLMNWVLIKYGIKEPHVMWMVGG